MSRALHALLTSAALIAFQSLANAQAYPDEFPLELNPTDANFEIYSQKNGTNAKTTPSLFRKSQAPRIIDVVATPSATGNATNRMEFVRTPDGSVYYIDWAGRSLLLFAPASASATPEQLVANHTGATVTITIPIGDPAKIRVWRSGRQLRQQFNDFTVTGNVITFTLPSTGNHLIIQTPQ